MAATGALGHVLPKRRADERHRRCRAKRRLSDPALAQKVRLLIMDRHWSLEEIDGRLRLEGGGRCVVEPADYSYRQVLSRRPRAAGIRPARPGAASPAQEGEENPQ